MAVPALESGRFKIPLACFLKNNYKLGPSGIICSNLKKNMS